MAKKLLKKIAKKIYAHIPPALIARVRYAQGHRSYFYPWGFAMNSQTARLEATRQMLYRCGIRQIVETGTFRGVTTEWFAQFGVPVTTIELDSEFFLFSKRRLRAYPNVTLAQGGSVDVLRALASTLDKTTPTLFYLDAHGFDYLPLRDELQIILPAFNRALIVIDDFQVPEQPGYAYDNYGPGKALTWEYLESSLTSGTSVFYPAVPAEQETGARRGWIVIAPDAAMAHELRSMELLRERLRA